MKNAAANSLAAESPRSPPKTAEALLDHEEALALHSLTNSVQCLGEDLCTALDLRRRVRRHPFLTTGLAALFGYLLAPPLARGLQGLLATISGFSSVMPARRSQGQSVVFTSLRAVRNRLSD